MADTGWVYPQQVGQDATGYTGWSNPSGASAEGGLYASTSVPPAYASPRLILGNFGFDVSIPSGSTLDGMEVEVQYSSNDATAYIVTFEVVTASNTSLDYSTTFSPATDLYTWYTSSTNGSPYVPYPSTVVKFGSSTTKFTGFTTMGNVASQYFGFRTYLISPDGYASVSIDFVRCKVYYTAPTIMLNASANDGGTWKATNPLKVNDGGTWKEPLKVSVNDGGVWKKTYGTES